MQLDLLMSAIGALGATPPATVTFLTVLPPLTPPPVGMENMPPTNAPEIRVTLNPPISDSGTIASLVAAMQVQADSIQSQLIAMGFTQG
jgi:hypothetical protein